MASERRMPWILLSFLPPRRTPTYCRWKDENKKQNCSRWHKPAAGLGAGTGSAWEGGSDLGSRMWGTLGRGAFLHGSAGHGEGRGQLAALGAVSYLPRPLSCPQPARESHRTPWVGFGHPSLVQKNPWSCGSWRWVSITKESPAIGDGAPPPWAGHRTPTSLPHHLGCSWPRAHRRRVTQSRPWGAWQKGSVSPPYHAVPSGTLTQSCLFPAVCSAAPHMPRWIWIWQRVPGDESAHPGLHRDPKQRGSSQAPAWLQPCACK